MKIILNENILKFEQKIEKTWIFFLLISQTEKTAIYNVIAKEGDLMLGEIKWFAQWRKYVFLPSNQTIFESKCLNDIVDFLNQLMQNRNK